MTDSNYQNLHASIVALSQQMESFKIDVVNRFDQMEDRFDAKLAMTNERIDLLEEKVDRLTITVDKLAISVKTGFDHVYDQSHKIEQRIGSVENWASRQHLSPFKRSSV